MTYNLPLIVAMVSALFAAFGLILNWFALRASNTTRQLQLLNDILKGIKETELLLYREYKNADKETKKEWDSLLFNSIEPFAFLVNEKFIDNKKISGFFDDAIILWYEQIFLKHFSQRDIADNKMYPEFKKLYSSIRHK